MGEDERRERRCREDRDLNNNRGGGALQRSPGVVGVIRFLSLMQLDEREAEVGGLRKVTKVDWSRPFLQPHQLHSSALTLNGGFVSHGQVLNCITESTCGLCVCSPASSVIAKKYAFF